MIKYLSFYCSLIGLVLLLGTYGCKKKGRLFFEISDFKNIDRVDTLEEFPEQGIYILGLYRHYALGHFTYDLGVLKKLKNNKQVFYKSRINPNILRISDEYLAFVDQNHGFDNIGWYYMENKLIKSYLPGFNKIKDSISKTFLSNDTSIYNDTFVYVVKNSIKLSFHSKIVKSYDYGEFVLKDKGALLDNLTYGLYVLENQTLKKISEDGEDINNKSEGIFYIPAPGLGITNKWKKIKLFRAIDSVTNKHIPLKTFFIDQDD
ncbi:MAG: hypothetical protein ABIR78_12330 [Ferruginibacter sp.]